MVMVIDREYTLLAYCWKEFPRIVKLEVAKYAEIIDIRCTGCDVSVWMQERFPDATESIEKVTREFHLYRVGDPYQKPSPDNLKRLGVVGEGMNKCVIYERFS
ncbi:MAG: hypothetical protein K2Z81_09495 [Cyanobacteria bacterium]|nr:hypothetical protein [Cyanobacteriota bacterium]